MAKRIKTWTYGVGRGGVCAELGGPGGIWETGFRVGLTRSDSLIGGGGASWFVGISDLESGGWLKLVSVVPKQRRARKYRVKREGICELRGYRGGLKGPGVYGVHSARPLLWMKREVSWPPSGGSDQSLMNVNDHIGPPGVVGWLYETMVGS